jgi:hypothetical protein
LTKTSLHTYCKGKELTSMEEESQDKAENEEAEETRRE